MFQKSLTINLPISMQFKSRMANIETPRSWMWTRNYPGNSETLENIIGSFQQYNEDVQERIAVDGFEAKLLMQPQDWTEHSRFIPPNNHNLSLKASFLNTASTLFLRKYLVPITSPWLGVSNHVHMLNVLRGEVSENVDRTKECNLSSNRNNDAQRNFRPLSMEQFHFCALSQFHNGEALAMILVFYTPPPSLPPAIDFMKLVKHNIAPTATANIISTTHSHSSSSSSPSSLSSSSSSSSSSVLTSTTNSTSFSSSPHSATYSSFYGKRRIGGCCSAKRRQLPYRPKNRKFLRKRIAKSHNNPRFRQRSSYSQSKLKQNVQLRLSQQKDISSKNLEKIPQDEIVRQGDLLDYIERTNAT